MKDTHIIIVEDEDGLRDVLHELLIRDGYDVTAASCGRDALRILGEKPVQALLTDLKLPDMDGLTLIEQVLQRHAKIACVMMTGFGTIDNAVKAMKVGAFDFITKPFALGTVSGMITKALQFRRANPENAPVKDRCVSTIGWNL